MAGNPKTRTVTREVPKLELRAAFVPSTLDEEKRTIELVWTTGSRVLRGFFNRFWEELSLDPKHVRMDRLNSGAPLLAAHNAYSLRGVMGVVDSARLEKSKGTAKVRFAAAGVDPEVDTVFRKVADGIIRNVSVGYAVHRYEKVEESDDKVPVYRATDWEPLELSLVPIGADAGAGVRAETADTHACEFVTDEPPEERAMGKNSNDPQSGTPAAPVVTPADTGERAALAPASTPTVDEAAIRREAAEAERTRSAEIRRVGETLGLADEFVARHLEAGTLIDAFRLAAVEERARTGLIETGRGIEAGEDGRDKWLRGAGDWLLERSGAVGLVAQAAKARGETVKVDPGEFRGMSLVELARQSLERAGVRTAGKSQIEIVGMALVQRGGGYHATGDFATLLEGNIHKTLLAAYAVTPDTWSRFCATGSVSDFRPHHRYRLGTLGSLPTVNEGGEYTNLALADATKESISAETKGGMLSITRQAIINDDLSAFVRLPSMAGRSAKLTIEKLVYALLAQNGGLGPVMADGVTLFHANHGNIGVGSALSMAAIDADRVLMAKQTDPSSNEILDLRPTILLVPVELGGQAKEINDAQYDPDTPNKLQKPNRVRGLFRDIVDSARLSATSITRRYLFADPGVAPTVEVVFLDGAMEPALEVQNGWRTDGVVWKVRIDVGVGAIDSRGAVTNAGA